MFFVCLVCLGCFFCLFFFSFFVGSGGGVGCVLFCFFSIFLCSFTGRGQFSILAVQMSISFFISFKLPYSSCEDPGGGGGGGAEGPDNHY